MPSNRDWILLYYNFPSIYLSGKVLGTETTLVFTVELHLALKQQLRIIAARKTRTWGNVSQANCRRGPGTSENKMCLLPGLCMLHASLVGLFAGRRFTEYSSHRKLSLTLLDLSSSCLLTVSARSTRLPSLHMLTKTALCTYTHQCLSVSLRAVSHHSEQKHLSFPEPSLSLLVDPLRKASSDVAQSYVLPFLCLFSLPGLPRQSTYLDATWQQSTLVQVQRPGINL